MSFDALGHKSVEDGVNRLNPFRAGRCLSTPKAQRLQEWYFCLNPFRAGRCLSTHGNAVCSLT